MPYRIILGIRKGIESVLVGRISLRVLVDGEC